MMKYFLLVLSVCMGAVSQVLCAEVPKCRPLPSRNLLHYIQSGIDVIGIVHFTVNTFTDREWGYGNESPDDFNPTDFSADEIVRSCRDGGLKGLVIVAKHHDGFCLWPTETTTHNISRSKWRGGKCDYVGEMARACRKYGLKFGVYCSPWDRNSAFYAKPEYVKIFHKQVEELNDGRYGEIFEMWFDGANGGDGYYGGAWEKRSIGMASKYYRMKELQERVRELQPNVCFFSGNGDLVWPGNERGEVPVDSGGTRDDGTFRLYEADFPLRPGWFYHQSQDGYSRSGEFLMKIFLRTVGNSAIMDIGIAPDLRGRLTDEDAGVLRRFAKIRQEFFSRRIKSPSTPFNVVVLSEDVSKGERVDEWRLFLDGKELVGGGKIGYRRIRVFDKPVSGKDLRLEIVKGDVCESEILMELYAAPEDLVDIVAKSEAPMRPPAPFELRGTLTSQKDRQLVYMMKRAKRISAVVIAPDEKNIDATPTVFRLSYSVDGENWQDDAAVHRLDNVAANPVPQTILLSRKSDIKYLKITVLGMLDEKRPACLRGVEFVP